jgi:hypothetical protein
MAFLGKNRIEKMGSSQRKWRKKVDFFNPTKPIKPMILIVGRGVVKKKWSKNLELSKKTATFVAPHLTFL